MHYPVMTERQLAARWKISLKTLRRWRSDNEGPTWHKLFQYVRYHEADVLDFERQSAQHWSAILGDGERVPKVVTRPPQEQPETEEDTGAFYITAQDVIEASRPSYTRRAQCSTGSTGRAAPSTGRQKSRSKSVCASCGRPHAAKIGGPLTVKPRACASVCKSA